jgi:ketosteroid isomerase-like protein
MASVLPAPTGSEPSVLWDTLHVSSDDAAQLRQAYEAFNEGGVGAILERLDPDIHVRDRETLPDRATYRGREGVKKMFEVILEAFDDLHFDVEDVIDRDTHILVVLRQVVRGRGSGIRMVGRTVHVWEMRDGRAVALQVFGTREQALASLDRAHA